jgi:hypothetical protein
MLPLLSSSACVPRTRTPQAQPTPSPVAASALMLPAFTTELMP